jgi:ABC-2 type transport system permease protein
VTVVESIVHEWRTRLSRPPALIVAALFSAALIYGAANGRLQRAGRLEAIAAHRIDVAAATARWLSGLQALEAGAAKAPAAAGSPMDLTFASHLPPAPLDDFAIGQSDLLPRLGALSLWSPDVRLFSRYELDDPVSLALGGFDLAKAVLFLLPIVLIVLCFDVLSADRDSGRLALILAQGGRLRSLLWTRLGVRAGALLGMTCAVSLAALLAPVDGASLADRLPFFLLWTITSSLYGLVWVGIVAGVAARGRSGLVNLMQLVIIWAALTLVVPAGSAAVAEAASPPPSRVTHLAEARDLEIRAERDEADLTLGFALDHPELVIADASEIPAYVRTAFLVTSAVDRATSPVQAAFDRSAARREAMLGRLGYLSPAIVLHRLLGDIAGTSAARHRRYAATAREFKAAYAERVGPAIVAGRRLSSAESASFPAFRLGVDAARAVVERSAGGLAFLGLVAGVLLLVADRMVRRAARPLP